MYIDGPLDEVYDWRTDILSPEWSDSRTRKLHAQPDALVCDALLDQDIFASVCIIIIKKEVLFRTLHPATPAGFRRWLFLGGQSLGRAVRDVRPYVAEEDRYGSKPRRSC